MNPACLNQLILDVDTRPLEPVTTTKYNIQLRFIFISQIDNKFMLVLIIMFYKNTGNNIIRITLFKINMTVDINANGIRRIGVFKYIVMYFRKYRNIIFMN